MLLKKIFIFVITSLLTTTIFAQAQAAEQSEQVTAATLDELVANGFVLAVNGDGISSYDIIQKLTKQLQEIGIADYSVFYTRAYPLVNEAVQAEIFDILMYQHSRLDMEKQGLDEKVLAEARLKRKAEIVREFGGIEPNANIELEKLGTSLQAELDKYERRMIVSAYRDVYRPANQTVTRVEMVEYYNGHKDEFTVPARMQFSLIESASSQQAADLYSRLQEGDDFAELAKNYSTGWRAPNGGLWNEIEPGSIKKLYMPVVEKLKALSAGELTGVIASEDKFFIGKLESYSPARVLSLSEVQDKIKEAIYELRWREYTLKLSDKLLKDATIGDTNQFVAGTIYTAWKNLGGKETQ